MNSYEEVCEFLFTQFPVFQKYGKTAFKPGLEHITQLCDLLGNPQKKFKSIHIGGTNGKGSTSHLLSAALQENGVKVGLYTSPHLADFRERVKINGEMISQSTVIDFVNQHKDEFANIQPSFFEWTVALAFYCFAQEEVDVAIIEVGMGGRLDSTNIISPILSIITNIGLDHTQYLGDTLPLIAGEKAGIIKHQTPVIIGETHKLTEGVFINKANEEQAPIRFADQHIQANKLGFEGFHQSYQTTLADYEQLQIDLLGDYQKHNLITTLCALEALKPVIDLDTADCKKGLLNAKSISGFIGRWDVLSKSPLTICDTGHNQEGLIINFNQLENYNYNKLHVVIGMVSDKDIQEVMTILPKHATYYLCEANIKRALPVKELSKYFRNFELKHESSTSVFEAYKMAKSSASESDLIFIGGSTFVVGDLLLALNKE